MKLLKSLLTFSLLLFVMFSFGQNNSTVELLLSKGNETSLKFTLKDYKLQRVDTDNGIEIIVQGVDLHSIREKGAPDLPKAVRSVIIPDYADMQVEVISSDFYEIKDVAIAPSKGHFSRTIDPSEVPLTYGEWYGKDEFYPSSLTKLNDPYILRDFRGQALDIYPFQYNPATKVLRVYTELTLKISETGKQGVNTFDRNKALTSINKEFGAIYSRQFINYDNLYRYTALEEEGTMLIIAHDEYMEAMQPFIEWKTKIGLEVEMVGTSTTGTTHAAIKTYITNYYNSNNLVYVLFVGDAEHIPPVPSSGTTVIEGYSDNFYGFLSGNDRYQEIFMGRFSAQSIANVQTQVQRTLEYEMAQGFADDWLNKGLGLARNEGAGNGHNGGEADYVHMDLIRGKLLSYNYNEVYREYDGSVPDVTNTTDTIMSSRINSGVGIINFCNHGDWNAWSVGGFNNTHVNALTNNSKLPFIWSVACINGQFQGQTCFAETWLRATNSGQPSGALAFFGSTINQPWHPPMDAQDEFNDILIGSITNNTKRTFGGISVNGMFKMLDLNNNANGHKTAETWTIFGDPSVKVRTDNPTAMNVDHTPDIMFGTDTFEATCDAEGAFGVLSKDGVIISTAVEDGGIIRLPIPEGVGVADELTLAITAYNKVPYIAQLTVISAGAYANFQGAPTAILIGESVTFTDASDGGDFTTWEWTFGEGAEPLTAIGVGPHAVTYNTPGRKTVSLLVDESLERVRENYINVLDIFILTVNIEGAGSVKVNGVDYVEPIQIGESTSVTIEATPDLYWNFAGWSGDLTGMATPQSLEMTANKTVTATFTDCSNFGLPFTENFNGVTSEPLCWDIADNQGNGQVWQFGTHASGLTGSTGNYAYLDSDGYGSGNSQNSDLITPTLDLSDYTNVSLSFKHYFRALTGSSAKLHYSINGGSTWTQVQQWTTTTTNPVTFNQVIAQVAGQSNVKFKWNYTGNWGWYWDIDDISITGTQQYTLTVNVSGDGKVEVNGAEYVNPVKVNQGAVLNLSAVAESNCLFDGWAGDLTTTEANESVTMNSHKNITATFSPLTSIDANSLFGVSVYPNPFNNSVTISNSESVAKVTITNIVGQIVMVVNNPQGIIETSDLTGGVYLFSFADIKGNTSIVKMIKR